MPPVDTAALRTDLAELVAVESPSADTDATAACAQAVAELGERLTGAAPQRVVVRGRTHLRWRFGSEPARVLLLGHLDTVWPLGTLARWPFAVTGDRASGPGVVDMKAGLVQLFHALATLRPLDGVAVLVTSDEELGSPTSRELVQLAAADAEAALVLEPSAGGALKTARAGIAGYRLAVTGRAAHAGLAPQEGVNALVELAHQVLAVAALGAAGTTVTPTVAAAGTTTNTVPAAAYVDIDVRAFEAAEFDRVEAALRALRPVLPGAALAVDGGLNRPPMPPVGSAALFRLAGRLAAGLGLGTPTLDGLGAVGGNPHAEGEWVDLAAMPERAALLAALVRHLLARSPS